MAQLDEGELEARRTVYRDIEDAVLSKWPSAELRLFGSFPVGLSTYNGDLDISIMLIKSASSVPSSIQMPFDTDENTLTGTAQVQQYDQIQLSITESPEVMLIENGNRDIVREGAKAINLGSVPEDKSDNEEKSEGLLTFTLDRTGSTVEDLPPKANTDTDEATETKCDNDSEVTEYSLSDPEEDYRSVNSTTSFANDTVGCDIQVHVSRSTVGAQALSYDSSRILAVPPFYFNMKNGSAPTAADIAERAASEMRRVRIEKLKTMSSHLRLMGWLERIEFRSRARVPIINLTHKCDIECDIGLGVDAEDTTAHVNLMRRCYSKEFRVVAFFLKMLLHHYDLDKPFTGGIGSYKVYVMVAYVCRRVQKHYQSKRRQADGASGPSGLGTNAEPDSAFLLLTFLKFFGDERNLNKQTVITVRGIEEEHMPLSSLPTAEFEGSFKLDSCCALFRNVYVLLDELAGKNAGSLGKKRTREDSDEILNHSYLARIFFCNGKNSLVSSRLKSHLMCRRRPSGESNSWSMRTDAHRNAVAEEILNMLYTRTVTSGSEKPINLSELNRIDPALASRLRSYMSSRQVLSNMNSLNIVTPTGRIVGKQFSGQERGGGTIKRASQESSARMAMRRDNEANLVSSAKSKKKKKQKLIKVLLRDNDTHNSLVLDDMGLKKGRGKKRLPKKQR